LVSPGNFLKSTSFRLLAWYAAVFVASVAILLLIVYWITLAELDQQLSESVERETDVLAELYKSRGPESTVRAIQLRIADLRRKHRARDPVEDRGSAGAAPVLPVAERSRRAARWKSATHETH